MASGTEAVMRAVGLLRVGVLVAMVTGAGTGRADTVYTDYGAWLAAASAGGPAQALSLNPYAVPLEGATVVDDELTLTFPQNHGYIEVFTDGWRGDVHLSPGPYNPGPNYATFARPIVAFGAMVSIGPDTVLEMDRIVVDIGDGSHRLWRADYGATPSFFGWVGDAPVTTLTVRSELTNNFYSMVDVQYVPRPTIVGPEGVAAVPLPAAAWGGIALLAGLGVARRHRRRRESAIDACR